MFGVQVGSYHVHVRRRWAQLRSRKERMDVGADELVDVQFAASKGYYLPTQRLQRSLKGFDIRAALHDNMAFKLSFGLTFMLAAFGGKFA